MRLFEKWLKVIGALGCVAAFFGAAEMLYAFALQGISGWDDFTLSGGPCMGGCIGIRLGGILFLVGSITATIAFSVVVVIALMRSADTHGSAGTVPERYSETQAQRASTPLPSDRCLAVDVAVVAIHSGGPGIVRSHRFSVAVATALTLQLEARNLIAAGWATPARQAVVYQVTAGAARSPRPPLRRVLDDLASKPVSPSTAIRRYKSAWTRAVLDRATELGLLEVRHYKVGGFLSRTEWSARETDHVIAVRCRLTELLVEHDEANIDEAVLIAMLAHTIDLAKVVLGPAGDDITGWARVLLDREWPELPNSRELRFWAHTESDGLS